MLDETFAGLDAFVLGYDEHGTESKKKSGPAKN